MSYTRPRASHYTGHCPTTGKRQYASEKQARRHRSHTLGARLRPYKCTHCGLFHLTHEPNRGPR